MGVESAEPNVDYRVANRGLSRSDPLDILTRAYATIHPSMSAAGVLWLATTHEAWRADR